MPPLTPGHRVERDSRSGSVETVRQRQVIVVCLLVLGASLVPRVAMADRQVSRPAARPAGQPRSKMADLPVETLAHTTISSGRSASRDVLNDNGGWCWFQDERAIFTTDGRLLVSSVAVSPGTGSTTRSGSVEITNRELATGRTWVDTLYRGVTGDDHNAAALVELPNKRIEAVFADHSRTPLIHPTHIDPRDLSWTRDPVIYRPEADVIDPGTGLDRKSGVTYSNLVYLADENGGRGRLYDFFRSHGERPHVTWSDDNGATWARGGELLNRFRAYTRYVGDGHHRIWFITTDGHPSVLNGTSLYAGYLQGGRVHRSDGVDIGAIGASLDPARLTRIARGVAGDVSTRVGYWGADIALDPTTGNPVVTFSNRHPGPSPVAGRRYTHDYFYGRWTGAAWNVSRLSAGGSELYSGPLNSQPDYTGLSAIDPADPNHVFISTDVDPVTNRPLISSADGRAHWEISEGRSRDGGRTWSWSSVTQNSTVDNLRPIVPKPLNGNRALLLAARLVSGLPALRPRRGRHDPARSRAHASRTDRPPPWRGVPREEPGDRGWRPRRQRTG